ncbi:MAG: hypothetical protein M4579_003153 [Chaenotheca gracillima]|nr:MAG: hypothetical protein M4579_003153 [Chaenotheca gracillima]
MLSFRASRGICYSCKYQLLDLFQYGFSQPLRPVRVAQSPLPNLRRLPRRCLSSSTRRLNEEELEERPRDKPLTEAQIEAIAREARQTFGETLPKDLLTAKEYAIYERLYGPPLELTDADDLGPLRQFGDIDGEEFREVLLQEARDGQLEEVRYDRDESTAEELSQEAELEPQVEEVLEGEAEDATEPAHKDSVADLRLRQDMEDAIESGSFLSEQAAEDELEGIDEEDAYIAEGVQAPRSHPRTILGRFGSSPLTLQLPKGAFTDPITELLSNSSNKHLSEIAHRVFDGPGFPTGPGTPASKNNTPQKPIKLEASQPRMGPMEADVYLAAVMPHTYAAVTSTLVEIRKRLGKSWLLDLMNKEGGPRVLDAGAGGAAVVAWREIVKAEWQATTGVDEVGDAVLPFGKSTVVTGPDTLRHRTSRFLENTTFLPRLPDYVHIDSAADADSQGTGSPRKQYDVIIAPHTLWPLAEDHQRKYQVQNLWSLLNPNGGVLILIEKGVPRGFEAIAGARKMLLDNHITPDSSGFPHKTSSGTDSMYTEEQKGMIVAPCTNHSKCPMYHEEGLRRGRKDFCHFSQRFIRPPYLQTLLGARDRNHEDAKFSYVAVQRGHDERFNGLKQGTGTTESAFNGDGATSEKFFSLGFPRAVLPPIKRQGHVILDLCTPAGRLERWTVPRSYSKQAYRDARKSNWGDLWVLGAKTRVDRKVRTGRDGITSRKGKNMAEVDADERGSKSTKHTSAKEKKGKKYKRNRKDTKFSQLAELESGV